MIKHEVNIHIEPTLKVSVRRSWFKTAMKRLLAVLDMTVPSELGLVITNDVVMRQLNKTHRGKDESTDVLAFPMIPQCSKKIRVPTFVNPPDGISHLGEIIISYPQAVLQSENRGHDLTYELLLLMVHGVLHLLGYDHEQSKVKERRMRAKEKEILKKLA